MSKIGYGHPPAHTRFQKGQSGNPGGRPKQRSNTVGIDLANMLGKTITVRKGGKSVAMSAQEIGLRRLLQRAIKDHHLPSALALLERMERYKIIANLTPQYGGVVRVPQEIPLGVGVLLYRRYGYPPWSKYHIAQTRADYDRMTDEQRSQAIRG